MNEVIHEFILETQENLAQLDLDLVTLEKDPTERETLNRIFRTLHTVKGTAGFLGLMKLQALAHSAENLLTRLTAGELTFNPTIANALLETVDSIRTMLASIEKFENEGENDCSELIQKLERLRTEEVSKGSRKQSQTAVPVFPTGMASPLKQAAAPAVPPPAPKSRAEAAPLPAVAPVRTKIPRPKAAPGPSALEAPPEMAAYLPPAPQVDMVDRSAATPPGPIEGIDQAELTAAEELRAAVDRAAVTPPGPFDNLDRRPLTPPKLVDAGPALVDSEPVLVDAGPDYALRNGASGATPQLPLIDRSLPEPIKPASAAVSETSIRVDVGLLDELMTLVGELVLTRNQIVQYGAQRDDPNLQATVQRLNSLTSDLQSRVMKTRMQPIGSVWNKFPRLVRDMSQALNKDIVFEMQGRETELDKTIIEAIRDPLMHMLRNAIDHGIETPAERKKRGKPAQGRVTLNAFHEGGKVIIEIADDGGGIDPQRVRKKAIQAKLITPAQANQMSKREILNLIFEPGFSTADKVSHFSGRGVGMNVVRANLDIIGGTVDIDTCVGIGTTFKIKIPLTLAIVPALTIITGGDRYAIPQINLQELIRIEADQIARAVEHVHGAPVYRLRGNLLPLVDLNEQLQVESQRRASDGLNIVVLQADDRSFGLIVDEIHDTQEIVVKPLQRTLKGINAFAGATIMGDGTIALILDVLGIAQRANVISSVRERLGADKPAADTDADELRQTLLVCAAPGERRIAVPIEQVARIEEFPRARLDKIGNQNVVFYRDELLPVIDVAHVLQLSHADRIGTIDGIAWQKDAADTVQIVVHAWEGKRVGLVVGRVLDIVESAPVTRSRINQPCILFTAVVDGRATEVIDIEAVVRLSHPEFFQQPEEVVEEV